jgi:hypothetical protein
MGVQSIHSAAPPASARQCGHQFPFARKPVGRADAGTKGGLSPLTRRS